MPPSDPHHPQWPYRHNFMTRRSNLELQRRHQESQALAAQSAQHLSEMHRYRAWAQHYRTQNPDLAQAMLCDQWAEYHRNWSVELGNRSKAAYNGWYTANQTTEITDPAAWAAVNTDQGQPQHDVPPTDGRPYGQRGGLRVPLRQHQDDLVAAMPRNPDGTLQATPDPRLGRWFGLANDGGPSFDPTRGVNCVDCMISAWRTWRGRPQVAAPRTLDAYAGTDVNAAANGETGGMQRVAAQVGGEWQTVFPSMAQQPAAVQQQWSDWGFATITQQLQQAGHGSAMMIVTEWQGGNSHAWLAVNQGGTILFLDPQTGAISENVTLYGHDGNPANGSNVVGLHALMLDANGQAQDIAPLAQTPWGQAAQQAKLAQLAQQQAQQQALAQQQAQLAQQQTPSHHKVQHGGAQPDIQAQHPYEAGPSHTQGRPPLQESTGAQVPPGNQPPDPGSAGTPGEAPHTPPSDKKAVPLYAKIRALTDDVESIAAYMGVPEEVVARARRNLFLETHDVAAGPGPENLYRDHYFSAYDYIAKGWLKAYYGWFQSDSDRDWFKALLAHEYVESRLMELTGMPYRPSDPAYWIEDEDGGWQISPSDGLFGAHDIAPGEDYGDPFGHYLRRFGVEPPDVDVPLDLNNLEAVVQAVMERFGLRP